MIFINLLLAALYAVFVQNLVLNAGLGLSEAIRLSAKNSKTGLFAIMISGFSVITSVLCNIIGRSARFSEMRFSLRAAIYGLVLVAVYLVSASVAKLIFGASKKTLGNLGIAALNTLVLSIPFINNAAAYTVLESVGFGLGAGVAFVIASALIGAGAGHITANSEIPAVIKGTPSLFFYVALLSLAFCGFSNTSLFT